MLRAAGLPPIPADAEVVDCYAWTGLTAGVYCVFEPVGGDWQAYAARLPASALSAEGVPSALLVPILPETPWFRPGAITEGRTFHGEGLRASARERFRLFVDETDGVCYLYYAWNWLRGRQAEDAAGPR